MRKVVVSLTMDLTYEVDGDKGLADVIDILEEMPNKLGVPGDTPFCRGDAHDLVSWIHDVEVIDDGIKDYDSKKYPGKTGESQRVSGALKGVGITPLGDSTLAFTIKLARGNSGVREYTYEASEPPEWWASLEGAKYVEVSYRRYGDIRRMYFARPDVPPVLARERKTSVKAEKALGVDELSDDIGPGFPKNNPDDDSDSMWGH